MEAYLAARKPLNDMVSLYVEYSRYPKVKRFATKIRVKAKHWDNESKRIRANGTLNVERDNKTIAAHLDAINAHIRDFHTHNGRWPSCEELDATVKAKAAPVQLQSGVLQVTKVSEALAAYIEAKKTHWQPLTVKSFQTLLHVVTEYEGVTGEAWTMETLTNEAVTTWQQWLMKSKAYKNSTLGKQVKKLKQFLKETATAKEIDLSKISPIHTMRVDSAIITLTSKEIAGLYRLDLSQFSRLERVRDLFVLQCYTGLRYSDVVRLRRADIINGFIKMETQKTVETTNIPLFTQAQSILEKYDYDMRPLAISNQKQNLFLKDLLSMPYTLEMIPTLSREVKLPEERGTVRKYPTAPLYTVVTTHVARKSFITACLELGQSTHVVKEFSGHKSDNSFKRYVNAAQGQVTAAAALQEALNAL